MLMRCYLEPDNKGWLHLSIYVDNRFPSLFWFYEWVYLWVWTCSHVHAYMSVCMRTCPCVYVYMFVYACGHVHVYMRIYSCMHVDIFMWACVHVHVCMWACSCVHVDMFICACEHVHAWQILYWQEHPLILILIPLVISSSKQMQTLSAKNNGGMFNRNLMLNNHI